MAIGQILAAKGYWNKRYTTQKKLPKRAIGRRAFF
jgi:hypothetical protein